MPQYCQLVRFETLNDRGFLIRMKRRSDPEPGTTVELGFLGTVIHADLPIHPDARQSASGMARRSQGEPDIRVR